MRSSFTRRQALKAGIFSLAGTAMGWQAAEAQVSGLPRFFYGDAAVQDGDGIASLALDGRTIYPAFSLGNGRGFVLMKGRASLRRGGFSTRLSRVIGSDRGASAGLVDGGQVEGDLFSNALGEGGFSAAEFPVDLDLGPKMVGFWVTPEGYKDFAQLELNRRGNLRAAGTLTGIGRFNFSGRWSPLVVEVSRTAKAARRIRPQGVDVYTTVGWLPASTSLRGLDPIYFPGVADPLAAVLDPEEGVLFLAVGYNAREDETLYVPLIPA